MADTQIDPQRNLINKGNHPPIVVINENEPLNKTPRTENLVRKESKKSSGSSSESGNDSNSKSENIASITHEPKPPPLPKVGPRPTLSLRGRTSPKPPNEPRSPSPTKLTSEPSTGEVTPPIEQPRVRLPGATKPVFPVAKSPNNTTIEISDVPTSTNAPIPRQRISLTTSKPSSPDAPDSDTEKKPTLKKTSLKNRLRKSEPKSPTEKSEPNSEPKSPTEKEPKTPNARLANLLTKSKSTSRESSSSDSEPENKPGDQPKPKVAFKPPRRKSSPSIVQPEVKFRPGGRMPRPPVTQKKPKRQSSYSSDSEPGKDLSESKPAFKSPQPVSSPGPKPRSGGRRARLISSESLKSKLTSPSSSDSETEKPKDQNMTNVTQASDTQTEPKSPPGSTLRRMPSKKRPAPTPGDAQLQPWAEKRPLPPPDPDPQKAMIRTKSELPLSAESENVPKRPLSSTFDNKPAVKPKPFKNRPTSLSIPPRKSSSSSSENESLTRPPVKPAIPTKPNIKKTQSPGSESDRQATAVLVPSPGENLDRSLSHKYRPPSQKKSDTTVPVLLKVTNKEPRLHSPTTP